MEDSTKTLKGFEQHGVRFLMGNEVESEKGNQKIGTCPFCGRVNRFYVNMETSLWDCKSCSRSGNFNQFLEQRSAVYQEQCRGKVISDLAINRGLKPQTLQEWGIGWSGIFYSVPVTGNPLRRMTDLRRYSMNKKALATAGSKLSFICPKLLTGSDRVWLCEGEWDGMALYETLRALGINDDVFAAPGAGNIPVKLAELFYDKDLIVCYDNDEAGMRGAERVCKQAKGVVKSIKFIHWPKGLQEGFDVRDYYHGNSNKPKDTYDGLLGMLKNIPPSISGNQSTAVSGGDQLGGEGVPAEEVYEAYKKWLYLKSTEPIDILFGTLFANRLQGDPLWLFLVAPPGGMKTELLMSLSQAPKIYMTTSLTPHALISGAVFPGGSDPSLIPKLNKKVMVIKDFTTILQLPTIARSEIFGALRDAFDGETSKDFGTVVRRYKSLFGIIAGVTPVIESLSNENVGLGERFIKYRIRGAGGKVNAGREAIRQALANIHHNDAMRSELQKIAMEVLSWEPDFTPEIGSVILEKLVGLAQFVASLRGVVSRERYTGNINYKPMAEIGTRLAKQFCKLAYGIATFKRETEVSIKTYETVVTVAQDTAPDRVEEIVKQLFIRNPDAFVTTQEISDWSRFPINTVRFILQDLCLLGICIKDSGRAGFWKLSPSILMLMRDLALYKHEVNWLRHHQLKPVVRRLR